MGGFHHEQSSRWHPGGILLSQVRGVLLPFGGSPHGGRTARGEPSAYSSRLTAALSMDPEGAMTKHADTPEDPEAAIVALTCTDRMKGALRLIAEGAPYREAAAQASYRDHREVYRWAKRAGLLDVHSKRLVAGYRRIAALSNEEIERRLIEAPGEIATKDLAVISGISADKAAKYEGWGRQVDVEPGSASKLLDRLEAVLASGNTLSLTVSPRPPDADAIDVTATPCSEPVAAPRSSGPGCT